MRPHPPAADVATARAGRLAHIRHIRQEHAYGCVLAALAMIGGETYAELVAQYPWVIEGEGGCDIETVSADYLWRHGFAAQLVYPYSPNRACPDEIDIADWRTTRARQPWPPAPWAPAHICQVVTSSSHAIVMLADGRVLDPLDPAPRRLSDYQQTWNVRGIFDVSIGGAR